MLQTNAVVCFGGFGAFPHFPYSPPIHPVGPGWVLKADRGWMDVKG
jgi:hypothetical protein